MASIVKRNKHFAVMYNYVDENGKRRQKLETYKTMAEAYKRKKEVEYKKAAKTFTVPKCTILNELLKEYVEMYGKVNWSMSTYTINSSLIDNYISPLIGTLKVQEITTRVIERYYQQLLQTETVIPTIGKRRSKYVTPQTIRCIHKLLHSCFEQAVKWEMIDKNPTTYATRPKADYAKRDIWTAETLFQAMETCQDEHLKLAMHLSFSCSLRLGEVLGLTWDCVDISEEAMAEGKASIYINKELQRVNRKTLNLLDSKDVIFIFPARSSRTTTLQVLKAPKTESSVRKVFLPRTVAEMLAETRKKQLEVIEALGDEYKDFGLVIASPLGMPMENTRINDSFRKLISKNDLPKVVFHSLRHSSITYKLKLNGGDIKAVQGDSGHSQSKMVTDLYSHILDDDRRQNAQLFEEAFYSGKGKANPSPVPENTDMDMLLKLLQNPEMAALIKTLAKNLQ
jgi:Site-specific recombinase XerD